MTRKKSENASENVMDSHKVTECIDNLCQSGCDVVRATIKALESDLPVSQTRDLNLQERQAVLDELKSIMAVYDR